MNISSIGNIFNIKNSFPLKKANNMSFKGLDKDVFESANKRVWGQPIENPINVQEKILLNILQDDEKLFERYLTDYGMAYEIKTSVAGFIDLYQPVKKVFCYDGQNCEEPSIYVLNIKENAVQVYDEAGELKNYFTGEDLKALKYAKYHPDALHVYLREGRHMYNGNFHQEMIEMCDELERVFSNPSSTMRTTQDMVLYRALQRNLSDEDIANLNTIGGIYQDKSFSSTSKNFGVAERFSCGNPILEISFPKGSKYIDVEKLFNIDQRRWFEDEYLLDKNSRFLVTGFDYEKNIVKVNYLP